MYIYNFISVLVFLVFFSNNCSKKNIFDFFISNMDVPSNSLSLHILYSNNMSDDNIQKDFIEVVKKLKEKYEVYHKYGLMEKNKKYCFQLTISHKDIELYFEKNTFKDGHVSIIEALLGEKYAHCPKPKDDKK
jgi:hypothetical protein